MLHQAPSTPRPRPPNFSRSKPSTGHTRKHSSLSLSSSLKPKSGTTVTSLLLGRVEGEEGEDGNTTSSTSKPLSASSPTKRSSSSPSSTNMENTKIPFPPSSDSNHPAHGPSHLSIPPPPYPTSPPPTLPPPPALPSTDDDEGMEPTTAVLVGLEGVVGLVNCGGGGGAQGSEGGTINEEWVKERSREELDRLLIEADRVIREREKELGIAAAIGKSLLENNIALRNKHESLLASFPLHSPHPPSSHSHSNQRRQTPRPSLSNAPSWLTDNGEDEQAARDAEEREEGFSSPSRTPINSYGRSSSARMSRGGVGGSGDQGWVFGRPSSRSSMGSTSSSVLTTGSTSTATISSPPRSKRVSALSFSSSSTSPTSSRHNHRSRAPSLSASPQAILYLREQNNDLALQLEQLQAETSDADHEGKKKLRKLEKEIGALRGNLERMNERNGELEEMVMVSNRLNGGDGGGGEGGGGGGGGRGDGGWAERRRLKREEEEAKRRLYDGNGLLMGSTSTPMMLGGRPGSGSGRRTPSPTAHLQQHRSYSSDHSQRSSSPGSSSQSTLSPPASPRSRSISLLGPSLSALSSPLRNSSSVNPSSTSSTSAAGGGDASRPRTAAELALVSQLLGKIRELEQANEEMRIKREAMDKRISRAKREGAELEGVYEVLEGEVERAGLEVVDVGSDRDSETVRRPPVDETTTTKVGGGLFPQPRTPSRQTGAAERKSFDQRSTPNKSPSTAAIELDFFSTSPSSANGLNNIHASPSSSLHISTSSPSPTSSSTPHRPSPPPPSSQRRRLSPSSHGNLLLPPSPSSLSVLSNDDNGGSGRFRSATGNRLMIETNKLRKKISNSHFLAPNSPAPATSTAGGGPSPRRRQQQHLRESMTPSPTAIHFRGGGGSPLKMRVDVRGDEEEREESPSKGRRARSWEDEAAGAREEEEEQDGEYDKYEDREEESPRRRDRRVELTPRRQRELRLAAMPSLRSLGSWGKGSTRGRAGRGRGNQALGSELGSQYASFSNQPNTNAEERDWEDDDRSAYYSSDEDYDDGQSVYLPSSSLVQLNNPAELALRSVHLALTPTEDGLYLDTSTPILPPGSLAISPPANSHTFDLLDQAVNQRPIRWADDDDELYGTSQRLEPATTRTTSSIWDFVPSLLPKQVLDPFETTIYPEPDFPQPDEERLRFRNNRVRQAVEEGEDPLSQNVLRPPTRRELALQRMGLEQGEGSSSPFGTLRRPFSGSDEEEEEEEEEDFLLVEGERGGYFGGRRLLSAPTDGPSDWMARLRPGNVAERLGRKWVKGLLDVWFFLQLIVVAVVFMKEAMKMGRKPRRAALGQHQQRRIA